MAVFLICEFDPFHFGHEYIIKEAKRIYPDHPLVCIMSGNFVQRGRPAMSDEYSRAECAVKGGADLVLVLPFPWCMSSAESFAWGAVGVISGLYAPGDALVFGSECADIKRLTAAADTVGSDSFRSELKEYLKRTKLPYAQGRARLCGDDPIFSSPNDILGVEYVKAAKALCHSLTMTPIKRSTAYESSTYIKSTAAPLDRIPEYAKSTLEKKDHTADIGYAERLILAHLRTAPYDRSADGEHGVIRRLSAAAQAASGFEELIARASTSQFTNARLRRVALYSYLGVCSSDLKKKPAFTQLLAANGSGLQYLSDIRKTKRIEIITKPSDTSKLSVEASAQYALQCKADGLYCFCTGQIRPQAYFLRSSPYIDRNDRS